MLVPVLAIRGTDPAAWDPPGDFIFLAILLTGVGAAWELAARVPVRSAYKAAAGIAAAVALPRFIAGTRDKIGEPWSTLATGRNASADAPDS